MDDVYQRLLTLERAVRSLQAQNASLLARIAANETRQNAAEAASGSQPSGGGGMAGWGTTPGGGISGSGTGSVSVSSGPLNGKSVTMTNGYGNSIAGSKLCWWWLDPNSGTFYVITADC